MRTSLFRSLAFSTIAISSTGWMGAQIAPSKAALQDPKIMLSHLSQAVPNYAAREIAAPPEVKTSITALRLKIQPLNPRFTIGYTTAADVPLSTLNGTVIPQSAAGLVPAVNQRGTILLNEDMQSAILAHVQPTPTGCSAGASSFDWRKLGKVTPVRAQICGTCWDFASMAAYEGSYAIRNNQMVDSSEQYILNCSGAGNCKGGWHMPVFDYLIKHGDATMAQDPMTGNDTTSCPPIPATYKASAWGFVGAALADIPTPASIKAALCAHGPLVTAIFADDVMQHYTGGVLDEHQTKFNWINHDITIIGWDDSKKAWLIKNSWGPGWGETGGYGTTNGYAWIAYDTNNIGTATAWVDAAKSAYKLSPAWEKIMVEPKFMYTVPK